MMTRRANPLGPSVPPGRYAGQADGEREDLHSAAHDQGGTRVSRVQPTICTPI